MYGRSQKLLVHAWIAFTSHTLRLDLNRCNLELAFNSKELRSVCEHEATAKGALGAEIAEALRRRLADLRAATSIADLIVGNPHTVEVGSKNYLVIHLFRSHQIVLEANHPKNPLTDSGQLDWAKVSRIKITHVGGYND